MTARDVANVFLKLSQPELGDSLTNLKLQKLVYYAQGFSLALYDKPLFDEEILAWEFGPVVRVLYDDLRVHGSEPVPVPEEEISVDPDILDLISEVNDIYGQFSAWKLRDMTHQERPWLETPRNEVISQDLLKSYFSSLAS